MKQRKFYLEFFKVGNNNWKMSSHASTTFLTPNWKRSHEQHQRLLREILEMASLVGKTSSQAVDSNETDGMMSCKFVTNETLAKLERKRGIF